MQDLNVAIVQCNQVWEDKLSNFRNYESLFTTLKEGVDLILLPEMFQTGFTMTTSLAENNKNSESILWLKKQAANNKAAIYTSLIIEEDNKTYNRGVFVLPDGTFSVYDKRKCFGLAGEDKYYAAGNSNTIVEYKGWKLQLHICYDLRFPEISRCLFSQNSDSASYDALLYVANWPEKRILHWDKLLAARSIENQSYTVACNRTGADGNGYEYNGHSACYSPDGVLLNEITNKETIIQVQLKHNELQELRVRLPFLKDGFNVE
ncbi:MAG: omega-amidase [Lentimonas sp.]|jgi:omega-amidase